ncbi:MAG: hypothetical protein QM635_08695 [Microbacteriaceae bacterium]
MLVASVAMRFVSGGSGAKKWVYGRRAAKVAVGVTVTTALWLASAGLAQSAEPERHVTASTAAALTEAVSTYDSGDAQSSLDLVKAATELAAPDAAEQLDIYSAGATSTDLDAISAPSTVEISPVLDGSTTRALDGAIVQSNEEAGTTVVTRYGNSGVQSTAILESDEADSSIGFDLEFPTDSTLVENVDGSITVFAPTAVTTFDEGEFHAVAAQTEQILAGTTDLAEITDDQWDRIEALPTVSTVTVTEIEPIATINKAWAVDATGAQVPTHYEIEGTTLTQVVVAGSSARYPITADPSVVWWVWTAASCVADLATFIFAAAKLAKVVTKMKALISKSVALGNLIAKLGGVAEFLSAVYNMARGLVAGNVYKFLSKSSVLALSSAASVVLDLIGDALGIGGCISLIKALA